MIKCSYCGKELALAYPALRCRFCGGAFCVEHHLPENHNCHGLRARREGYEEVEVRLVNNFVFDVSYVRSVDGLLIKFGSLISEIWRLTHPFDDASARQLLSRVLLSERVLKALSPFSDHVNELKFMVESDPRHRLLRSYISDIVNAMNEAKKHRGLDSRRTVELVRPPLREVEEEVKVSVAVKPPHKAGRGRTSLKPIASIAVLALTILALLIALSDFDGDGLINYEELRCGTDLLSIDTDGDGLSDGNEAYVYGTDPRTPLTSKLTLLKTALKLQGSYLVIEHAGRWLPYAWIDAGGREFHLTYFVAKSSIVAEHVFVNSSFSLAKYPLRPILSAIGIGGVGSLIVKTPDAAVRCRIVYLSDSLVGFEACESVSLLVTPPTQGGLHEAILAYVNETSLRFLKERLLGDEALRSPTGLAWHVLAWLSDNASYDYSKASLDRQAGIYDPITFYCKKSGICSDYALFTVAVLLAGGLRQAYAFIIDTAAGGHAMAGAEIDGRLFVLDQLLPPYEWEDYVEYVFQPIGEALQVIKVWVDLSGKSSIEAWTVDPTSFASLNADSYPLDRIPRDLIEEAIMKVCRGTNTVLKPRPDWKLQVTWQILGWSPLKAYSPTFHSHFADFLAGIMLKDVGQYFSQSRYVWYEVREDTLILYFG